MISIENLTRTYAGRREKVAALKGIDLEVPDEKFFTLLGPSGCGKSTTLRCIAGLEHPDGGRITIDGETVFSDSPRVNLSPERRRLAMVFQSYAIWPHMNCAENTAFPLESLPRGVRPSRAKIGERVDQALASVQLGGLAQRPATALSGGQKQRLALARALVMEPSALLLDEPLSNLDAKLREDMRLEIRSLQRKMHLTVVYVTHDQAEALAMSNLIAVMRNGQIEQIGTPREIYNDPATPFVANFIGELNTFPATIASAADGEVLVDTPMGRLRASARRADAAEVDCLAMFRPEYAEIRPLDPANPPPDGENGFEAIVARGVFYGQHLLVELEAEGHPFRVRVHPRLDYRKGDKVWVAIDPADLRVLHPQPDYNPWAAEAPSTVLSAAPSDVAESDSTS